MPRKARSKAPRAATAADFRAHFELASVGMAQAEPSTGRLLRVNAALCAMTGFTERELVARTFSELTHPEDRARDLAEFQRMVRGERPHYSSQKRYVRKDGSTLWVVAEASLLRDRAGRPLRTIAVIRDVDAQIEARDQLAATEHRLSVVTDNAMLGLLMKDRHQQVVFMNPAAERITGYTLAELRGRPLHAVVHHSRPDGSPYPADECPLDSAAPLKTQMRGQDVFVRRDGTFYPVEYTASPIVEGGELAATVIELRDLTEQRRTEEARSHAERLATTIANNATLGLFMMDARQHCTFMNPAAVRITGFALAEVQGKPLHDVIHFLHPDGTPYPMADCPIDRALPTKNQEQGEDVFIHKDGTFYPVAFTASPIVVDGKPVGTVIEVRDTTEEKRREREREELLAELQEAVRVRDEFLSVASHELKTPLTSLALKLGSLARAVERGQEPPTPDRWSADLEAMRRQLRRLTELVNDLLDVTRIAAGRMALVTSEVDLGALIRTVAARFEAEAARAGCTVTVDVRGACGGHWDGSRLQQVVENLLSNAFKYGAGQPVTVRCHGDADTVELVVEDRGIGIPPAERERIFEKFARAVSDRHYGGLGLGLYVARQIVRAHRGEITAGGEPGQGAVFTVRLPRDPRTGLDEAATD